MNPREWRRIIDGAAARYGGTVENRGSKLVIILPTGGRVWCAATPARPAPDRVERDIKRELVRSRALRDINDDAGAAADLRSSRQPPRSDTQAVGGSSSPRTATPAVRMTRPVQGR